MLSKLIAGFGTAVLVSTSAAAQGLVAACPVPRPAKPDGFPTWLGLSIGIAPEFTQNHPFHGVDFDDSDKTTVSITATAKRCITDRIGIKVSGGPSVTLDDDNDSKAGSKLSLAVELRYFSGIGPIVPLIAYGTSGQYTDIFETHVGDEQFLEAGASFGDEGWDFWRVSEARKLNLSGRAVWKWVDADMSLRGDYHGPSAELTLKVPIMPKKIAARIKGTYANNRYDRYEEMDPIAGKRRHDKAYSAFVGLDVAGVIQPRIPVLREASVGVTWDNKSSNIDGEDHKLKFQPSIRLGLPF